MTLDEAIEEIERLRVQLETAYHMCARPSGVCFDPKVLPQLFDDPANPDRSAQYDGDDVA